MNNDNEIKTTNKKQNKSTNNEVKPKSKYQTFIKDNFKKFKSDNQELKNSEIFKLLAQEWKKSKN